MRKFYFKVYLKDKRCYNYNCFAASDDLALKEVKSLYGHNIKILEQEIGGQWLTIDHK